MLRPLVLDRPSSIGSEGLAPEAPGTARAEHLIEWGGIAIFVVLAVSAVVILV